MRRFWKSDGLMARCVRSAAALSTGTAVERTARFVRNMILARLLAPDQFGLMALVLSTGQLFEVITEVGIRQAVIQNKMGDTDEFLNVAWWFSAVRGLVLYLIGFTCAPLVGAVYHEPLLVPLMRVAFISILLRGLATPRLYVFEKQLRFWRYVFVTRGSELGGTILSLVIVVFIPNIWALVIGFVSESALRLVASMFFCPVRLPRLRFDGGCMKDLFTFSRGTVGLSVLTFIFTRIDLFVMGRMLGNEQLGLYFMVLVLAEAPNTIFARVVQPVILPALSNMQDEIAKLRFTVLRMTQALFAFGGPVAACMIVFGKSLLTVVFGSKFSQMGPELGLAAVFFLFYTVGTGVFLTYLALGRPGLHRTFSIVRVVLMLLTVYPAIRWFGTIGAVSARLVCLLLASAIQVFNLTSLLKMPIRDYFSTAGSLIPSVLVGIIGLVLKHVWGSHTVGDVIFAGGLCMLAWGYELFRIHSGSCFKQPVGSTLSVARGER